jgi:hypothetical protein
MTLLASLENKKSEVCLLRWPSPHPPASSLQLAKQKTFLEEQSTAEHSALQNELKILSLRNTTLEADSKRSNDTLIHLNQTIKSLHHSLQSKDSDLLDSHDTLLSHQEQFQELTLRYTSSQAEIEKLRLAVRKVNEDVQNLLKENNKFEHSNTELTKTNQNLEMNLFEMNSLCSKKETENSNLKSENEKLSTQLSVLREKKREQENQQHNTHISSSPPRASSYLDGGSPVGKSVGRRSSSVEEVDHTPGASSLSPNRSASRTQPSGSINLENSFMSRSVPLPMIESEDGPRRSTKSTSSSTSSSAQVYYKGVPIEQLRSRSEFMDDDLPHANDLQTRGGSLSQRSSGGVYPSGSYHDGVLKPLTKKGQQPSASVLHNTESEFPSGGKGGRLPSITRDLNVESQEQKKFSDGTNFVPFAAARSTFPSPSPSASPSLVDAGSASSFHNRRSTNLRSANTGPPAPGDSSRKSLQEKTQMIERIIEETSQHLSPSASNPSAQVRSFSSAPTQQLPFHSSPLPNPSTISSDEENDSVSERRFQKSKTKSKTHKSERQHHPTTTGQGRGGDEERNNVSPVKKKKYLPIDSLHQKVPCAICGMHFSGDGLKLPHSTSSGDNHSQSSGQTCPSSSLTHSLLFRPRSVILHFQLRQVVGKSEAVSPTPWIVPPLVTFPGFDRLILLTPLIR